MGFALGDRVVAEPLISCGRCEACRLGHWHVCRKLGLLGIHANGAFAQYVCVASDKLVRVPDGLEDRAAALAEPFAVGFHVCRRGELRNGETALVIGAGPIGLVIGMVAKVSGADVTFCEVNPERIDQARSFGFPVVDGNQEPAAALAGATQGEGFDAVFEVSGSQPGVLLATEACRIRGRVVQVGFFGRRPEAELMKVIFKELTLIGSRVYSFDDFRRTMPMLARIVGQGAFDVCRLISETCPLDAVEASIHRMIRGEVRGKILVDLNRV
jgi:2-desacetyl-2-hydroxyethyl bacteriochlorophyllide A dehydrogenase